VPPTKLALDSRARKIVKTEKDEAKDHLLTGSQSAHRRPAGDQHDFYIVGMGGSAGGLEAFGQFFTHMPADAGMAFVVVPHLEPTHKGMMPELLQRNTAMKVVEVADGMKVQPNCVYIIPPNADLAILHGVLQVLEPLAPRGLRTPVDSFFQQLAMDQKEKAIAILFSGMGSDGTRGLKAIKENLGMVMAQDPASAKYDGMPRNAINTGLVDYIAPGKRKCRPMTASIGTTCVSCLTGPWIM
jgi:two-component system, chemotaxis family, CheB/CheR fusion protein